MEDKRKQTNEVLGGLFGNSSLFSGLPTAADASAIDKMPTEQAADSSSISGEQSPNNYNINVNVTQNLIQKEVEKAVNGILNTTSNANQIKKNYTPESPTGNIESNLIQQPNIVGNSFRNVNLTQSSDNSPSNSNVSLTSDTINNNAYSNAFGGNRNSLFTSSVNDYNPSMQSMVGMSNNGPDYKSMNSSPPSLSYRSSSDVGIDSGNDNISNNIIYQNNTANDHLNDYSYENTNNHRQDPKNQPPAINPTNQYFNLNDSTVNSVSPSASIIPGTPASMISQLAFASSPTEDSSKSEKSSTTTNAFDPGMMYITNAPGNLSNAEARSRLTDDSNPNYLKFDSLDQANEAARLESANALLEQTKNLNLSDRQRQIMQERPYLFDRYMYYDTPGKPNWIDNGNGFKTNSTPMDESPRLPSPAEIQKTIKSGDKEALQTMLLNHYGEFGTSDNNPIWRKYGDFGGGDVVAGTSNYETKNSGGNNSSTKSTKSTESQSAYITQTEDASALEEFYGVPGFFPGTKSRENQPLPPYLLSTKSIGSKKEIEQNKIDGVTKSNNSKPDLVVLPAANTTTLNALPTLLDANIPESSETDIVGDANTNVTFNPVYIKDSTGSTILIPRNGDRTRTPKEPVNLQGSETNYNISQLNNKINANTTEYNDMASNIVPGTPASMISQLAFASIPPETSNQSEKSSTTNAIIKNTEVHNHHYINPNSPDGRIAEVTKPQFSVGRSSTGTPIITGGSYKNPNSPEGRLIADDTINPDGSMKDTDKFGPKTLDAAKRLVHEDTIKVENELRTADKQNGSMPSNKNQSNNTTTNIRTSGSADVDTSGKPLSINKDGSFNIPGKTPGMSPSSTTTNINNEVHNHHYVNPNSPEGRIAGMEKPEFSVGRSSTGTPIITGGSYKNPNSPEGRLIADDTINPDGSMKDTDKFGPKTLEAAKRLVTEDTAKVESELRAEDIRQNGPMPSNNNQTNNTTNQSQFVNNYLSGDNNTDATTLNTNTDISVSGVESNISNVSLNNSNIANSEFDNQTTNQSNTNTNYSSTQHPANSNTQISSNTTTNIRTSGSPDVDSHGKALSINKDGSFNIPGKTPGIGISNNTTNVNNEVHNHHYVNPNSPEGRILGIKQPQFGVGRSSTGTPIITGGSYKNPNSPEGRLIADDTINPDGSMKDTDKFGPKTLDAAKRLVHEDTIKVESELRAEDIRQNGPMPSNNNQTNNTTNIRTSGSADVDTSGKPLSINKDGSFNIPGKTPGIGISNNTTNVNNEVQNHHYVNPNSPEGRLIADDTINPDGSMKDTDKFGPKTLDAAKRLVHEDTIKVESELRAEDVKKNGPMPSSTNENTNTNQSSFVSNYLNDTNIENARSVNSNTNVSINGVESGTSNVALNTSNINDNSQSHIEENNQTSTNLNPTSSQNIVNNTNIHNTNTTIRTSGSPDVDSHGKSLSINKDGSFNIPGKTPGMTSPSITTNATTEVHNHHYVNPNSPEGRILGIKQPQSAFHYINPNSPEGRLIADDTINPDGSMKDTDKFGPKTLDAAKRLAKEDTAKVESQLRAEDIRQNGPMPSSTNENTNTINVGGNTTTNITGNSTSINQNTNQFIDSYTKGDALQTNINLSSNSSDVNIEGVNDNMFIDAISRPYTDNILSSDNTTNETNIQSSQISNNGSTQGLYQTTNNTINNGDINSSNISSNIAGNTNTNTTSYENTVNNAGNVSNYTSINYGNTVNQLNQNNVDSTSNFGKNQSTSNTQNNTTINAMLGHQAMSHAIMSSYNENIGIDNSQSNEFNNINELNPSTFTDDSQYNQFDSNQRSFNSTDKSTYINNNTNSNHTVVGGSVKNINNRFSNDINSNVINNMFKSDYSSMISNISKSSSSLDSKENLKLIIKEIISEEREEHQEDEDIESQLNMLDMVEDESDTVEFMDNQSEITDNIIPSVADDYSAMADLMEKISSPPDWRTTLG